MSNGFVGTHTLFSTRHQRKDEAGMLPCSGGTRAAPRELLTITGKMEGVGESDGVDVEDEVEVADLDGVVVHS